MTKRTDWRKTCAELIENVRYLIDCVDRDCFDPVALMECREHLSQTRTALAQPEPEGVIAPSNRPIISAPKLSIFAVNHPTIEPVPVPAPMRADTLAAIIREVDGTHRRLGAAALAEAILAHPAAINAQPAPVPVAEVG